MMKKDKIKYSREKALNSLYKYCSYQERCCQEVIGKLVEWGFGKDDEEKLIDQMIRENYLNEERYASAYVRGKFNIKKWGTQKIIFGLKQKDIPDNIIQTALSEIPQDEYEATLVKLIKAKAKTILASDIFIKKTKIARYMIGKGFNSERVWEVINSEFR